MVATSPLASGQLTSRMAEFFMVWKAARSASFLALVLRDARLDQLFQESGRERFAWRKADRAFRCFEVLEFLFELYGWPRTGTGCNDPRTRRTTRAFLC